MAKMHVDLLNLKVTTELIQILKDVCLDERIRESIREEYMDKINELIESR